MDEKQLLDAIRGIVQEETGKIVDAKIDALREDMTAQNHETRTLVENGYTKIENLLREDYGRVAGAVAKVADYDTVKGKVSEHQNALESHNQRLTELEKKAI